MDENLKKMLQTIPKDTQGWLELRRRITEKFVSENEHDQNAKDVKEK